MVPGIPSHLALATLEAESRRQDSERRKIERGDTQDRDSGAAKAR